MYQELKIVKTTNPKVKPDQKNLGFGKYFTDHMFVMDYIEEQGWINPRIVPYGPIELDPAAMVLHYGQEIFEGMKAYRGADDKILLYRPHKNMERINISCDRLCMPPVDGDEMVHYLMELLKVEKDWIPSEPGTSLYVRPFLIATDAALGVKVAKKYQFYYILSPVGAYYPEGINPVKIYVESHYVRAVRGGIGYAKTGGNYAASLKAQVEAAKKGYTQVLWLDGVEQKYIEEVGTMNVFFVIGDEVVTPALNGSILAGITRDSTIELLKMWGMKVSERKLSIQEVYDAHKNGQLKEAFGTGTAAVISPIGKLCWNDDAIDINDGKIGEISQKIYDTVTGIQSGKVEDKLGWALEVK